MSFSVNISICIPVYKNIEFLKRCLNSIMIQKYEDYEVVLSDDSPDSLISDNISFYKSRMNIIYIKNKYQLGTPENWNEAIRHAKGRWIKIMHDDDWFTHSGSLAFFAKAAERNPNSFIASSYIDVFLRSQEEKKYHINIFRKTILLLNPVVLIAKNSIGPPSVTMYRNDKQILYDTFTKWVVDIDFYIRRLQFEKIYFIPEPCINVGLGEEQVTQVCLHNPDVELRENVYLMNKVGWGNLRNLFVYDFIWRLMRNHSIKSLVMLEEYVSSATIPFVVLRIIEFQRNIPYRLLKMGFFSKFFMFFHYLINFKHIPK